jgi:predicted ATPase/DNA-binding SARP family transcriptional activator
VLNVGSSEGDAEVDFELRLLGPLEVVVDGAAVVLRSLKQRQLLAVLALEAGSAVSADAIQEALWAGNPPPSARHAIEVYVSQLRARLQLSPSKTGPPALRYLAGAYALDLTPKMLDVQRFERLHAEAQAAAEPQRASALAREALSLWRGQTLADFAFADFAQAAIIRIDEARLATLELRLSAELRFADPASLAAELRGLVLEQPWRERLWQQLMLALYKAGRQAEAVEVYATARHMLLETVGLEPSGDLRALQRAILNDEVDAESGRYPEQRRLDRARPRGHAAELIGREHELADLARMFNHTPSRLVTIVGPGGVGKTRLGTSAAAALAERGHIIGAVDLSSIAHEDDFLPAIVRSFRLEGEVDAAHLDGIAGLLSPLGPVLLVLDSFEALPGIAQAVAQLARACPSLRLLATSREPVRIEGEVVFQLGPLAVPHPNVAPGRLATFEAVRLFILRAREANPTAMTRAAEIETAAAICRRLDGLPLAIELAAARVRSLEPAEILARLDHQLDLLTDGRRDAPQRHRSIRQTIAWSFDLLDDREQQLLAGLSVFPDDFGLPAAEAVGQVALRGGAPLEPLLSLVDKSLVQVRPGAASETRFRLLDSVRAFADEQLQTDPHASAVRRAHAEHYLAELEELGREFWRGSAKLNALGRLRRELHNAQSAIDWALEIDDLPLAAQLVAQLSFRLLFSDLPRLAQWINAVVDATGTADPRIRFSLLNHAAQLASRRGDNEMARSYLRRLHAEAQAAGDSLYVAIAAGNTGGVALDDDALAEACSVSIQAIRQARAIGDRRFEGRFLQTLSLALLASGKPVAGRAFAEQAQVAASDTADPEDFACAESLLAQCSARLGHPDEAREHLRLAAEVLLETQDHDGIARALETAAEIQAQAGETELVPALLVAADQLRARFRLRPLPHDIRTRAAVHQASDSLTLADESTDPTRDAMAEAEHLLGRVLGT